MNRFFEYYWIPILFIILCAGIYLTYLPHLNYPYPFHIDEWQHFAMAEETLIIGKPPTYFPVFKNHPGVGTMRWEWNYHSLLAVFFSILPIPHETTMILIPSIMSFVLMMSSFLLIYHLTRSKPAALIALMMSVMIKSNITLMGSWFAVPVAAGITFIPLILYLFIQSFDNQNRKLLLVTLITYASATLMNPHLVVLLIIFGAYLLFNPRKIIEKRFDIIFSLSAIFILFIIFVPSFLTDPIGALEHFKQFSTFGLETVEIKFNIVNYVGYAPLILALVGVFFSIKRYKEKSIILTILFGSLLILIYIYNQFDVMILLAYRRAFIYFVSSIMLISAFSIYSIVEYLKRYTKYANLLFIPLFLIAIYEPITTLNKYSGLLKQYISDDNYADILWMRDNLQSDSVVLASTEVSTAIYPIAHKYIANYAFDPNQELTDAFRYPCTYMGSILQYEVTHIYSPGTVCDRIRMVDHNTYEYY